MLLLAVWQPASVPWALLQLVKGPFASPNAPGLLWRKVLGSGHHGGFGLTPGLNRLGLFCAFDDSITAQAWLNSGQGEPQIWRSRAKHLLAFVLEPTSCRGSWSGHSLSPAHPSSPPSPPSPPSPSSPVGSLTRASIQPGKAKRFWSMSPAAQASLGSASGCLLAVGLGEAPLLRQATFSIWSDQQSMDAYARTGAHQHAIAQAYSNEFFSESMFARFRVLHTEGDMTGFASYGAHR